MSTYCILKASENDVHSTLEMFVKITDALLDEGVDQWNYDYPDLKTISEDIDLDHQFVVKEGMKVIASIVLNDIQDEQYKSIQWLTTSSRVLVIHRLGVHPDWQGKGLGKQLCLFAEEFCKQNEYQSIRLDAYSGNVGSNYLYQKLGYEKVEGYCYFRNKSIPFNCYEKIID